VSPDNCLFCGVALDDGNRSAEHVFPRWLQDRYQLANQELTVANDTFVRYAQLLVPACLDCNNVHGSQLEERVSKGLASDQEMWMWMLKLQLGVFYWESGKPLSRDQRSTDSEQPIFPLEAIDITYFQTLFAAFKTGTARFEPEPSGSLLSFPLNEDGFDYADRLYRHERGEDGLYAAAMVALDRQLWIALFDDGRRVLDTFVADDLMNEQVQTGQDPRTFFPELMYLRSLIVWHPTLLIGSDRHGEPSLIFAAPTMTTPTILDFDDVELETFKREYYGIPEATAADPPGGGAAR
jgi:hypothetical protein